MPYSFSNLLEARRGVKQTAVRPDAHSGRSPSCAIARLSDGMAREAAYSSFRKHGCFFPLRQSRAVRGRVKLNAKMAKTATLMTTSDHRP